MRVQLMVLSLALLVSSARGAVILQDTFTQNPGNLNNRAVETPQTAGDKWGINNTNSGNDQIVSGQLQLLNATSESFYKAIAPFTTVGISSPYTLSFDITILPNDTATGQGSYIGFGNGPTESTPSPNGSVYADSTGGPMFNFVGVTTNSTLTLYAGNSPSSKEFNTTLTHDGNGNFSASLSITVDPTTTTNNVQYFVNGTSLGTDSYNSANIGGIWTKGNGIAASSGIYLDNVLIQTVPEPASFGALAIGAAGLLMRRRRV